MFLDLDTGTLQTTSRPSPIIHHSEFVRPSGKFQGATEYNTAFRVLFSLVYNLSNLLVFDGLKASCEDRRTTRNSFLLNWVAQTPSYGRLHDEQPK